MNGTALALAFAFSAIAIPFVTQASKEADPVNARNKRLLGVLFLVAAAGFAVAFAISLMGDR